MGKNQDCIPFVEDREFLNVEQRLERLGMILD